MLYLQGRWKIRKELLPDFCSRRGSFGIGKPGTFPGGNEANTQKKNFF
jgi:hypothetical protein